MTRARRSHEFRPVLRSDAGLRRRVRQHQRQHGGGGNVHLDAHGADRRDEIDHPADLRLGGGVIEAVVLRPGVERQHVVTLGALLRGNAPQLFRDERHKGVQKFQDFVECPGGSRARFVLGSSVRTGEHRLDQFQIPITIDVPDEAVDRGGGLVELVGLKRCRDFPAGLCGLVCDPAVERLFGVARIEIGIARAAVDLGKTRGVPELGRKTSIAGDTLHIELDIAPLRGHRGEREPQGVGAILVDQFQRVDDVAFRLRHLGAAWRRAPAHGCRPSGTAPLF